MSRMEMEALVKTVAQEMSKLNSKVEFNDKIIVELNNENRFLSEALTKFDVRLVALEEEIKRGRDKTKQSPESETTGNSSEN